MTWAPRGIFRTKSASRGRKHTSMIPLAVLHRRPFVLADHLVVGDDAAAWEWNVPPACSRIRYRRPR